MGATQCTAVTPTPPSLPEVSPSPLPNEDIENDEPTAELSYRLKTSFRQQYTASKNIMNCTNKKQLILRSNRQRRYQSLMESPSDPSVPLPAVVSFTPSFEQAGIKVTPPAFHLLEVDRKQFIVMRKTPICNDYELLAEIGKGSFGSVLRAKQRTTGETRAVKRINKLNLSLQARLSLINEFELLRRLDHPNIIKLYEMYDAYDCIYVVTELCQGGNLLEHVTSTKAVPEEDIRAVMRQLLGAVRYMHDNSILHRDIKLENIVLVKRRDAGTSISQRLEIKLIDFGISIDLTNARAEGNPMGTLLYMSPQALDSRLELSSDIYSCGIVLFIMATRRVPFNYKSQEQLMQKIIQGDILQKYITNLDIDLRVFLPKLIEGDYKKRLTAKTAMDNAWLNKTQNSLITRSQKTKLAQQMLAYDAKNNLISLIQGFLVCRNINQEQRQRLARLFQALDQDRSGVIQLQQLKQFYHKNSVHYDSSEIEELSAILDKNHSGNIDFNQFITAMYSRRELFQLRHLETAFDFLDADGSGEISKVELEEILKGVQHEEIRYLFKEVDKNRDQFISKTEFLDYFRSNTERPK